MKTLKVKAVLITDGEHYMIHGTDAETSGEMFKAMSAIWHLDPATEIAHYLELEVNIPELESTVRTDAAGDQ